MEKSLNPAKDIVITSKREGGSEVSVKLLPIQTPMLTRYDLPHLPAEGVNIPYLHEQIDSVEAAPYKWATRIKNPKLEVYVKEGSHLNPDYHVVKAKVNMDPSITLPQVLKCLFHQEMRGQWDGRMYKQKIYESEHPNVYYQHLKYNSILGIAGRQFYSKMTIFEDEENQKIYIWTTKLDEQMFKKEIASADKPVKKQKKGLFGGGEPRQVTGDEVFFLNTFEYKNKEDKSGIKAVHYVQANPNVNAVVLRLGHSQLPTYTSDYFKQMETQCKKLATRYEARL